MIKITLTSLVVEKKSITSRFIIETAEDERILHSLQETVIELCIKHKQVFKLSIMHGFGYVLMKHFANNNIIT